MIRPDLPRSDRSRRGGFTLIELLVVIVIILLVSAVALPTILPALNSRQVSESARILQGALVGARDKAIHDGQPSGIRLLPDPTFFTLNSAGTVNPTQPLAYNRIIPISPAPEYSEGSCTTVPPSAYNVPNYSLNSSGTVKITTTLPPYPLSLMIVQSPIDPTHGLPNAPTSWYWNIRVGDKIQINNAGAWYTVMGPMLYGPSKGNPEMFVNLGLPGPLGQASGAPLLSTTANGATSSQYVEYLLLVNGVDDNHNGWIDEGWDNVDNDGDYTGTNGLIDEPTCSLHPGTGEWEKESWLGSLLVNPAVNVPYSILRRPAPLPGAREIALPTDMVIDATTWSHTNGLQERSRLPVNQMNGLVELMVNPDGTVYYTLPYGTPSSVGMESTFYHFWLAERQDVVATNLNANATAPPYLPLPTGVAARAGLTNVTSDSSAPLLEGDFCIVTLNTRTGQIVSNQNPPFLFSTTLGYNNQSGTYHPSNPFIPAEQGVNGGAR